MSLRNNYTSTINKKNIYTLIGIVFSICLVFSSTYSQNRNYIFKHFTQDNGLLSNNASVVYQDRQGYMWIGGFNGLQRCDGYRFVNFYSELHNDKALHTNIISNIFEDSKGRLWIGTDQDGIYILNRNNNTFYSYNSNASNEKHKATIVRTICEDANNNIWFATRSGFFKLNNITNLFENKSKTLGFDSLDYASTISSDAKGNLWFCGTKTFKYFNVKTNEVFNKKNNPKKLKIFDIVEGPARIGFDKKSNIWFATPKNVLCKFNVETNNLDEYDYKSILKQQGVTNIPNYNFDYFVTVSSSKGNVIVGFSELGIALYDDVKDCFNFIASNKENYFGLHNFTVGSDGANVLTDKDGLIWICGREGVEYFNPNKQNFQSITKKDNLSSRETLPSLEVSGILQSKHSKDIFISYYSYKTSSGIYRVDSNFNVKNHYIVNPNKEGGINQIWDLFEDDEGIIWAPTQDKIILQLNPKTDELKLNRDTNLNGYINYISKDANGDLWFGYWSKGLKIYSPKNKQITSLNSFNKNFAAPIKRVYKVYFDGDSIAWISTHDNGLVYYDKRIKQFVKSFTYSKTDIHSISSNIVSSICAYNKDTLLIATSEGLNIFDKNKQIFTAITNKQGLPSNFVIDVFLDASKNIWVCCANGICKINPKNWLVTNYNTQDGLLEKGITKGAEFLDNNNILLGSVSGLIKFNTKEINDVSKPSNISITSVSVLNQDIIFDSLLQNNLPIKLNYLQNNINIGFSSFDYSFQNKITYYYKLDGVDKDWTAAGNEAIARYNNLSNGTYIFSVKSINDNGVACDNITKLTIIIKPPFYKTWWFVLLEILILVSIVWGLFKWKNKNTKRIKSIEAIQQQLNRQLAETKMQALRSQMNPHFVFNSLNSINHFILSHDTDNASNYLTKFSRLIRLILDNSRNEWGFLDNEIKALELYIQLEAVRFDNAFKYIINVDENVSVATIQIPPLIIQPYVENAIWHGLLHKQDGEAKLQINIWMEGEMLHIKIADNGVGRAKATAIKSNKTLLHKSHGMKITSERLDIANNLYKVNAQVKIEDLKDEEDNPIGTIVLITIKPKTNASHNS